MGKLYYLLLFLVVLLVSNAEAQSPICGAATQFCAENSISYPASTNVPNPPASNNYGCLATQPNPSWFYMSTTGAGSAVINLSSAPAEDIDFAVWGPFSSLGDALGNCGSLGNPISCSYSGSPTETVSFSSGGPGEFYIMLITNFSNNPTEISGSSTSPILSCNACLASGGTLEPGSQVGCFSTLSDITVDFGPFTPDPTAYGYSLVVTDPTTSVITQEFIGTTLSPTILGPGTFRVCGISYEFASAPTSFLGQSYSAIGTDLASATPSFCGDLSNNCVDITIRPDPIPSFVVDSVCLGSTAPNCPFINNTYICDPGAGSFTVQNAVGCDSMINYLITPRNSVVAIDSVEVCPGEPYTVDGTDYFFPGPAVINIPSSGTGCDTTLFVFIQENPLFAFINPNTFNLDCLNPTVVLSSAGSSTGPQISQEWEGPSGFIGTTQDITVSEPGTYTFTVTRTDPRTQQTCTQSATATITQSPPETGQPTANGPATACPGESVVYTYSYNGPNPPYTFNYEIRDVAATVVSDGPGILILDFTASGTATVCFTATGFCGTTPETCITTIIDPIVPVNAGQDIAVCGLVAELEASPSGGTWTAIPGADGTGSVDDPTLATTEVSASGYGRYLFEYAFGGNCPSADTVSVLFLEPPSLGSINEVCDNTGQTYTVTFEIVSGTPPFMASGTPGSVAGNFFTSNPILSGDSYSFLITDANGCTVEIQGSTICSCSTDVGVMPTALIEVCVPDSIRSGLVSNEFLDANDVGTYVLHTSPTETLGTVLQTNADRWFYFQAPVAVDVVYYVSFIVGNDDGTGNPDPLDPCFDVSIGQPVVWREAPPIDAGPDQTVCGLSTGLEATGTPGMWAIPAGTSVSSLADPRATFSAAAPGTYTLTWSSDGAFCPAQDEVEITLTEPLTLINEDEICDNATQEYVVTFEIIGGTPPYISVGSAGSIVGNIFTSDPIASGDTYDINILDANSCVVQIQGSRNCDCATSAGVMPTALIEVCVPDSIRSGLVSNEFLDANDVGTYVLHTSPTATLGTVLQTNADRWFYFQAPVAVDVVYYVSFIVGNDDGTGIPNQLDSCFDVSAGQPVVWREAPPIDAGPDQTVCGLSTTLEATGTPGMWAIPAGTSVSSIADPRATFSAAAPGTYTLTWSSDGAFCPVQDEVEITLTEPLTLINEDEICDNATQEYVVTFEITGGTPPYISVGSTGSIVGNIFTSDPIASGDTYDINILDANSCVVQIQGSRNCDCATSAGVMPTALIEVCVPDSIRSGLVSNEFLDANDVGTYVLHTSPTATLGTVLQTNVDRWFYFQAPVAVDVVYYVSFIVGNDDGTGIPNQLDSCFDVSAGQPVVWREAPLFDAGPDQTVCGLSTALEATGTPGMWTIPAGTSVSSLADPRATFSASAPGTYTLAWSSDGAFCPAQDEVEITFGENPEAINSFDCDSGDSLAVVTITASAGQPPYRISGLPVSGTGPVFTASVRAGVPYTFTVIDANGCESTVYTNTPDCDCETLAPTLSAGVTVCQGEDAVLPAGIGGFNDGDDVVVYVLHAGSAATISNVLAISTTTVFPWDPTYTLGTTYYVAAVSGNDDGSGGVDPTDPCRNVSAGVPVVWNALPTLTISDVIACEGDTAQVSFQYSGMLPAEVDLVLGGVTRTYTITALNGTFAFFDEQGTLSVSSLRENLGCVNTGIASTADISIQTIQEPELEPDFSLCNSDLTGNDFSRDLNTMIISGGGGTWSSPDAPGALTGTSFNALGLSPGRYRLVYQTAAVGTCPSQQAEVFVTIRDCNCPNLTLLGPGVLCNNDARIELTSLLETPQVGDWSFVSTPPGAQPATLAGGFFDATSADDGTYRLLFTLTQGNVNGCPDTASLAITVAREPIAGFSNGDLNFCEGASETVDLSSLLTGQDAGGDWNPLQGGVIPVAGSVDVSSLPAGEYTFEYVVRAPAPCNFARAEVRIFIDPVPQVDAGEDVTLTCIERTAALGTADLPGFSYSWSDATTGDALATTATYQTDLTGLYELTVVDNSTGCAASDLVEVEASDDVPEVYVSIQPISCAGEGDGSVRIDSIVGGTGPYSVSFNGQLTNERAWGQLSAGAYGIEVQDANGCTSDALTFDLIEPEVFDVFLDATMSTNGGSGSVRLGDTVFLSAITTGDTAAVVQWSPAEYVACDTCANTYGIPPASLTYAVSLVSGNGCTADDFIQVFVRDNRDVFFPTGFSPNSDGVNDRFFPHAQEGLVRKVNSLIILDRWGEMVYRINDFDVNDQTFGWDGRHEGQLMNPQVLVFLAEVEYFDGRIELFKGDFSLIR